MQCSNLKTKCFLLYFAVLFWCSCGGIRRVDISQSNTQLINEYTLMVIEAVQLFKVQFDLTFLELLPERIITTHIHVHTHYNNVEKTGEKKSKIENQMQNDSH